MTFTNYWVKQIERLETFPTHKLKEMKYSFAPYKEGKGELTNYYHHILKEYAERIGKKEK